MRPRKPHAKSEIGRRPDSRIEVGVLGLTDIVNNLAAVKKVPRMRFSVLFIGISPCVDLVSQSALFQRAFLGLKRAGGDAQKTRSQPGLPYAGH